MTVGKKLYLIIVPLFTVSIVVLSFFLFGNLNQNLYGVHEFRQAQTAISIFYLVKNGLSVNYITPILGSPWGIPLEFPTYQNITAFLVNLLNSNLEVTARLVSISFFIFSCVVLYYIAKKFIKNSLYSLIPVILFFASPLYIFFSRAVMIESTALFFSLLYLLLLLKITDNKRKIGLIYLILSSLIGSLASITKITTFIISGLAAFIFFSLDSLKVYKFKINNLDKEFFKRIFFIFVIPTISTLIWNKYSMVIRTENPLANNLFNSPSIIFWNFGNFQERFNPSYWLRIINFTLINLGLNSLSWKFLIILGSFFTLFINKKVEYKLLFVILLGLSLSGPLIFFNVYYVHIYYYYANLVFLILALSIILLSVIQYSKISKAITIFFILPIIIFYQFKSYYKNFYPHQIEDLKKIELSEIPRDQYNYIYFSNDLINYIKYRTNQNDILMIYGFSYDSTLPYYLERRVIMDPINLSINNNIIRKIILNTGKNKIKFLVFSKQQNISEDFKKDKINFFGFNKMKEFNDAFLYFK